MREGMSVERVRRRAVRRGSRGKWVSRPVIAASLAVLVTASAGLAQEPEPGSTFGTEDGLKERSVWQGIERIKERATTESEHRWEGTADEDLIRPVRIKEAKWARYLKTALDLPKWLDLGLENRTRFEVYDHPWRVSQSAGQTDPQIQQRSRVRFGLNGGPFRFLFEGQDSRVHLAGPDSFVGTGSEDETDILQLFVSATAKNLFDTGLRTDLHLGRLTADFGRRRLIARNDFRNTTNAFDGVHWQLGQNKAWRVRSFLFLPVVRKETALDTQSEHFVFWGTYYENLQVPWFRHNVYYFGLNDRRSPDVKARRTLSTFGLRLYEIPKTAKVDYELEGVVQTGTSGTKDQLAYFGHLDVGYSFDLPWSPRFLIQYDYASGTRDPNGSQSGTFDTLFGARRFELVPTGSYGPFFRSNISSPGFRVIASPAKGWTLQLKFRFWYLAQAADAFAGSGLQDPTGGAGNDLGQDLELRAVWKINDNLLFDAGYDHWFKGDYFKRLPPSAGLPSGGEKDTDYFYVLTTIRL